MGDYFGLQSMSNIGDFNMSLELEPKGLNEQLKQVHIKRIEQDTDINSSRRCMPLQQAFEEALYAVDNVATNKVKTGYTTPQEEDNITFSSPAKWVIVIIGSQEGVNLL